MGDTLHGGKWATDTALAQFRQNLNLICKGETDRERKEGRQRRRPALIQPILDGFCYNMAHFEA